MRHEPRAKSHEPGRCRSYAGSQPAVGLEPPPPSRGGAGLKKGPDYNPISIGGAITHRFTGKLSTPRDLGVTGEPRGLAIDLRDVRREHAGGDGTRRMGKKTRELADSFRSILSYKKKREAQGSFKNWIIDFVQSMAAGTSADSKGTSKQRNWQKLLRASVVAHWPGILSA